MFSHGIYVLPKYLLKIFNAVLAKGFFPSSWAKGYMVPIHKKGPANLTEKYRDVTLLSTIGKLFQMVLNTRLPGWAENYQVFIEAEVGFRSNMDTTDNIFVLPGLITHLINQEKRLFYAFVDFSKAFVNRDNLWYKHIKLGERGNILNVIKNMYKRVRSRVKYKCIKLRARVLPWVRQGE